MNPWTGAIFDAGNPYGTRGIAPDRHPEHTRQHCRHPHFTEPGVVRSPGIDYKCLPKRDGCIIWVFGISPQNGRGSVKAEGTGSPPISPKVHPPLHQGMLGWDLVRRAPERHPCRIAVCDYDQKTVFDVKQTRKRGGGHLPGSPWVGGTLSGPGGGTVPPLPFFTWGWGSRQPPDRLKDPLLPTGTRDIPPVTPTIHHQPSMSGPDTHPPSCYAGKIYARRTPESVYHKTPGYDQQGMAQETWRKR